MTTSVCSQEFSCSSWGAVWRPFFPSTLTLEHVSPLVMSLTQDSLLSCPPLSRSIPSTFLNVPIVPTFNTVRGNSPCHLCCSCLFAKMGLWLYVLFRNLYRVWHRGMIDKHFSLSFCVYVRVCMIICVDSCACVHMYVCIPCVCTCVHVCACHAKVHVRRSENISR